MKWLIHFIPKESPKPMGRWNLDYCDHKINKKIDLSNEDHCGPCGEYALIKRESSEKKVDYQTKNK